MLPGDFTLLQVTPALDLGGVETLTLDMAAAVADAGARALVASRGGAMEGKLAAAGGELIRLPVHARDPLTMAFNAARLQRIIRRERVNLVHVRSRAPAFSAIYAARRTGVPVVATYHGVYASRPGLKRWYNGVMTRGDAVIVNSDFTRNHVLGEHRVAAERVVVIPEGVNSAIFDPSIVSSERVERMRAAWGMRTDDPRSVVLLAARMAAWKGHRIAVSALKGSAKRGRTLLVFVGDGQESPYAAELRREAARGGVELLLAGRCDDMPAAYLAADLVIAPSTEPESFGRTVAEACSMARLVVASSVGGQAETIVHAETGLLARPGEIHDWTTALDEALAMSAEERAVLGRAARARIAAAYSSQRMCDATFALYCRLSKTRQ